MEKTSIITIEQAISPQPVALLAAYQTFDKYLASIRVYSEYDEAAIYAERQAHQMKAEPSGICIKIS